MDEYELIEQRDNDYHNRIAPLEVEIERLREALKKITQIEPSYDYGGYSVEANRIAKEALGGGG